MNRQIVLIACVNKKISHKAKAKDLYISPLFKYNLKYARKLNPDDIYILSAKYGLLNLEQEIEPYEKTLNNMKAFEIKQWANSVLKEIGSITDIKETRFIFLAGEKYRKYLLPHLNNTQIPLKGLTIGKQLQRLKRLTA